MKAKRINFLILIVIFSLFICGCSGNANNGNIQDATGTTTVKETVVPDSFDKNGTGMLKCSTEAYAEEGIDVELDYTVKYKKGNIMELVSIQKVISLQQNSLDLYESAYRNIANNYIGLDFYDTSIVRDDNSVTYIATINYDKVNISKLLDIEGKEDNIVKNGKAKLSLWLDLAGKIGTVCEEV